MLLYRRMDAQEHYWNKEIEKDSEVLPEEIAEDHQSAAKQPDAQELESQRSFKSKDDSYSQRADDFNDRADEVR